MKQTTILLAIAVILVALAGCPSLFEKEEAPVVEKTSGPSGTIFVDTSVFEWKGSAPDSNIQRYEYRKNEEVGEWIEHGLNTQYTWSNYSTGSHTFEVRAFDDQGLESNTVKWEFTYEEEIDISDSIVSGGHNHTVVLKHDGTVWTWGGNTFGQLGDGTQTDRYTPVQVVGTDGDEFLANIVAVAAGDLYSMVLKDDGTVWTWGSNTYGQLGDGTTQDKDTPVQVIGEDGEEHLTDIVAIAAEGHSVALREDGTVWTWGSNDSGQLGDGTTEDRDTPVQVVAPNGDGVLENIVAIAAGRFHTMALEQDGTVWTWGRNGGVLGDGTEINRHTPVKVKIFESQEALEEIVFVAGSDHTLAVKDEGTVFSWGNNLHGQLGDGTTEDKNAAVQVKGPEGEEDLTEISLVEMGREHSIALKDEGTVWTWGNNQRGQLGNGTNSPSSFPVQVKAPDGEDDLEEVLVVAAGTNHSIAVKADGSIWTWGRNWDGQLGNGSIDDTTLPVQVLGEDGEGNLFLW